jgi:uncharacterized protein (TIGR03435 family)
MTCQIPFHPNRRRALALAAAAWITLVLPSAFGQNLPAPPPQVADPSITPPAYDVISIKPNKSASGGTRIMNSPDGFSATNVPIGFVISNAYGIRQDLISGLPGWADSARYDITAKVAAPDVPTLAKLTRDQRNGMLKPLLADRFKLQAHEETKTLPAFELVLSKGGSKLHQAVPGDTYPNGFKGPDGSTAHPGMMMMGPGRITAQAIPISNLINILSRQLQRTIIDKTGLTGNYDITLQWSPDPGEGAAFPGGPDGRTLSPDSAGPYLFTALEEQLGLKLNSTKSPVQTLVIDHIDPPTED